VASVSRSSVDPSSKGIQPKAMQLVVGYLDAGTGSMIMQALAGGIAGVAVVGKLYWRRLKRVFARRMPGEDLG
jgi:hypothetical protein